MNQALIFVGGMLLSFIMLMFNGAIIAVFFVMRKKKNPIDIKVYEFMKGKGFVYKEYIGRIIQDPHKGATLVACKFSPKSIQVTFGQKISDNYYLPSSKHGRKLIVLGKKDQIYVPMDIGEVEESFNLSPVLQENMRFALDSHKDAQNLYNDRDKELARTLIKNAILIFGIAVVGVIIIIIILITQGPAMASQVGKTAVKAAAPAIVPGLPG